MAVDMAAIALGAYIFINIAHREMILVSNSMFWVSMDSTKFLKITSVLPKWVNPKWPPRWPPKMLNGYNVCSMADNLMKIVTKYSFSSMSNSSEYMKIISGMDKWYRYKMP